MAKRQLVTEDDYVTEEWRHFMCLRCWFKIPGHIGYNSANEIVHVVKPSMGERASDRLVQMCCVCAWPEVGGAYFFEDPEGLNCKHLPNGHVKTIPTKPAHRRGVPPCL